MLIHIVGKAGWGVTAWQSVRVPMPVRVYTDATHYEGLKVKKRKPAGEASANTLHLASVESDVFAKLHALVAHCSHTQYDDGSVRKVGWFTVKTMGASWVVDVKDPDTMSKVTVVQTTLDDALALASVLLESEECPWEPDPWLRQAAGRNAKK